EMPHVFEMLDRVSQAQGGGRVPQWLATHPNPENRRGRIEQEIAAGPQTFAGTAVNRESYLQRLDGLVFGANPREGYFKGSQFFHPELRIRMTFPDGWTMSNGKEAVDARWSGYQDTAERSLHSFGRLIDPAVLGVQPQRLSIVKVDRRTTIEELERQRPSPVSLATLALVNQVEPATPLEPGRLVKW